MMNGMFKVKKTIYFRISFRTHAMKTITQTSRASCFVSRPSIHPSFVSSSNNDPPPRPLCRNISLPLRVAYVLKRKQVK